MDLLSDVITLMRGGRPVAARMAWQAPWAQEFASVPGSAGFQIVLRGPCWLSAPDTAPVPLAEGDIVFRPHGHGHTLADSPSTRPLGAACDPDSPRVPQRFSGAPTTVTLCGAYELDPGRVHPLIRDLPPLIHLPADPGVRGTVALLAAELDVARPGADAVIPALLDTLLVHILRTWLARSPALAGWPAALGDQGLAAALHAMHRDPARPWTVAALAAEAGLSRAPFARRFTALLGRPPLTYLTWWRMTTAARLLTSSEAPLSAVAARVGYGSEFAFAHAFKREFGTAPGRYRRASTSRRTARSG